MTLGIYKNLRTSSPKTGRTILALVEVSPGRFRHRWTLPGNANAQDTQKE